MPQASNRVALVEWVDSVLYAEEDDLNELVALEPAIGRSVGWVLHDDAERIVLALDQFDGTGRLTIAIPRCAIRSVVDLATP